jgi:protein-tyrosine-phosphatase
LSFSIGSRNFKKKIPQSTLIDSAGTAAYHIGKQPDPRGINVGKKMV